ncbi:MAG: SMC-Scp complex subunit ScpB [Vicinamibacteria bacterium]|nr:SMC-Scp complex subunit ScpB [Vicinamibacteria bacterium]
MSENEIKPEATDDVVEIAQEETAPLLETDDHEDAIPEELHPKPEEILAIVEALTFVSKEPVTMKDLARVFKGVDKAVIEEQLAQLKALYEAGNRGLQFIEVAGGYQITSRPEHNEWVRDLLDPKSPARLSTQALETLAVIAYKQPATLPEIIELRGIKSGGVVKTLLERRLIKIMGRKEVVGRPLLYGTTKEFLLQFGLKDLDDLPKIEDFAEILGEDVDVVGLKRALETPTPIEVPFLDPDPPDPDQRDLPFDSTVDAADILEAAEKAKAGAGSRDGMDPDESDS